MNENKDFYTREDESIEARTRISTLHGKEKWSYFRTYYLMKTLLLIVILVATVSIIVNLVQASNDISMYIAVVGDELKEEEVLLMEAEFETYLDSDRYDVNLFIDHAYVAEVTLLDVKIGVGGVNLLIAEDTFHAKYPKGNYIDLGTLLSQEILEKVKDDLCYLENEEGITYAYGVDLEHCKKYQKFSPTLKNPIIAIPANASNIEFAKSFIEYLWED